MRSQFSSLQFWYSWKEFWDCCQALVSVLLGDWASVLFLIKCQTRLQLNPTNFGPLNAMKWVEYIFFSSFTLTFEVLCQLQWNTRNCSVNVKFSICISTCEFFGLFSSTFLMPSIYPNLGYSEFVFLFNVIECIKQSQFLNRYCKKTVLLRFWNAALFSNKRTCFVLGRVFYLSQMSGQEFFILIWFYQMKKAVLLL